MLRADHGLRPLVGRVIMEAVPFAVGIGISDFILKPSKEAREGRVSEAGEGGPSPPTTVADAGATTLGAVLVSSSIAPTEEIPLIAAALSTTQLITLIGASLVMSYLIVFEAEFISLDVRRRQQGMFQSPFTETVFSYLISLLVAGAMLWLFHSISFDDPPAKWVEYTVVLGFPAAVGGAAGRLAI
jgi:putative integral membrane protein (TIGR02587 family)